MQLAGIRFFRKVFFGLQEKVGSFVVPSHALVTGADEVGGDAFSVVGVLRRGIFVHGAGFAEGTLQFVVVLQAFDPQAAAGIIGDPLFVGGHEVEVVVHEGLQAVGQVVVVERVEAKGSCLRIMFYIPLPGSLLLVGTEEAEFVIPVVLRGRLHASAKASSFSSPRQVCMRVISVSHVPAGWVASKGDCRDNANINTCAFMYVITLFIICGIHLIGNKGNEIDRVNLLYTLGI